MERSIDILDLTQNAAKIFKTKSLNEQRVLLSDLFSAITLTGKSLAITWRPETEVVRNAVSKTKRLEKILEPSSDLYESMSSLASRSIWLTTIEEVITAIKSDLAYY